MKKLSKKQPHVVFVQWEDRSPRRLSISKVRFQRLLSPVSSLSDVPINIVQIFETNPEITTCPFSQTETDTAVEQMKLGKAPGLDGLPTKLWKLPNTRKFLCVFCNDTLSGNRSQEWGKSSIIPTPKKGNSTLRDNYRGLSLTQVSSKSIIDFCSIVSGL